MTSDYESHSDDEIIASKRKRTAILDDESEDEAITLLKSIKNNEDDYESGNSLENLNENENSFKDNEDDEEAKTHVANNSDQDEAKDSENENDTSGLIRNENPSDELKDSPVKKKYVFDPSIYDAEDSDSENDSSNLPTAMEDESNDPEFQNKIKNRQKSSGYSKSTLESSNKKNKKKEKKPKEPSSADNMREIRRESQRMLRESHIILPYHVPKQRTLAEFLNRKKSAPSIPIRTTAEQLMLLSKQIQQVEKDSQEFFKSESSDDGDDDEYFPENDKTRKTRTDSENMEQNCSVDVSIKDLKEAKDSPIDENFNEEKNVNDSNSEQLNSELNEQVLNTKSEEETINMVTSALDKVVEKLQNENIRNSHEDLLLAMDSGVSTSSNSKSPINESTDLMCHTSVEKQIELKEIEPDKAIDQSQVLQTDGNKGVIESELEPSYTTGELGSNVCAETNSSYLTCKNDESDSEEFTLNLTMPEDTETVVEPGVENNEKFHKENSISNSCENLQNKIVEDQENTIDDSDDKENVSVNKTKKIELLSKINVDLNKVPKLSTSFGGEINLDSPPKKSGITDLKERFFKHYAMDKKKKKSKSPLKVSVISASMNESGQVEDISKEIISASAKQDELWLEEIKEAEFPGAKHSKLKAFLESKVKAKWKEDYEKRLQEYKLNEEVAEDEKAYYEHEAILDDEDEEADMTNSEEEDEELVEDDVKLVDKKRNPSKFVEDEADVTEDELENDNGEDEEDILEEDQEDLLGYNEDSDEEEKEVEDSDNETSPKQKKKTKKRIIKRSLDSEDEYDDESRSDEGIRRTKSEMSLSDMSPVSKPTALERKCSSSDDDEEEQSQPLQHSFLSDGSLDKLVDRTTEIGNLSTDDLADICSGKFPSQPVTYSQIESADRNNVLEGFADVNSQLVGDSQNFDLSLTEHSHTVDKSGSESGRKSKGSILDSDDDDELLSNRSRKKKAKAVEYSDDENDDNEHNGRQDESDEKGSENSEEVVLDEVGNEELEMEYDSEENEIVRDPKAFFEKEAELSESDWDSEDEDEKDLDKFEEEAGDQEAIDEDELNSELGKIHMQQMLVEDKREVRILQELLLEDGELHSDGSGRKRQFRWANADSNFGAGDPNIEDSDNDESDQGEDEENWRKKRHERELFLNKKNTRLKELGIEEDDEDEEDDGLLGMGRALVKKMQTTTPKPSVNITTRVGTAVTMNCKFMAKNMKGSFLTSSDQYLSRLAHITTKVGSESNVNGPKNSRNFVFSIVSPKKDEVKEADLDETKKLKKRKASDSASNTKKKIHFNENKGNEKRKSLLEVLE